jgi:hypothetical protein
MVFALIPNKSKESYARVSLILEKNLSPISMMTDFEQGLIDAFTNVFPGTQMRSCFFHFGQCFWQKIQDLPEIRQKYMSDADFGLKIKQLMALAFVPVPHVVDKFDKLMFQQFFVNNEELLILLIDYFEETWIGRPTRRNIRRPPVFDLKLWNQYDITQAGLPKTNNYIEGWHRAFLSLLGAFHPTIW